MSPSAAVGIPPSHTPPFFKRRQISLLALFSLIAGLQGASQYVGYAFAYQPILGGQVSHVYLPWMALNSWWQWGARYPSVFRTALDIGVMVSSAGLLGCIILGRLASHTSMPQAALHGSARWANRQDIEKAGLLAQGEGVYVGAWEDHKGRRYYLRHNGPEHVLTYAPTRSGKGVGLVLPTLLSWRHSVVITDLKGELWAMTAGWRKQYAGNNVLRFEPAAAQGSIGWNCLEEIRIGTEYEVGDVQNLATLIVDPDGKGLDTHWQKRAQALLVGLMLHVIYKAKKEGGVASLSTVDAALADRNMDITKLWVEMTEYLHVEEDNHPTVAASARDMMDTPEEEAGSILSTAKSYLSLYRDPVVAKNISRSEFCIKDLMNQVKPVSLYIITQPNDKMRLRPLVRILMNMIVRLLADKMEFERIQKSSSFKFARFFKKLLTFAWFSDKTQALQTYIRIKKNYKHRLLCLLDEFPSLGKMEILQESLAFVAGYGIKFYLICQDLNQLKSRETGYGPDETITSNCHIQNAYPPNRLETAEHLSKLTGQTTIIKEQITTSGRRTGILLNQVSRTFQEIQRPLLTVDECLRMLGPQKNAQGEIVTGGDMVIYVAGFPAVYGKQPLYFQDETFMARAAVRMPETTDKVVPALEESVPITL